MPRMIHGRRPYDDMPPLHSATIDGTTWRLFLLEDHHDAKGWLNLKLIAEPHAIRKANYWIGWHPDEQRFAYSSHLTQLRAERRAVYDWLKLVLTDSEAARLIYGS